MAALHMEVYDFDRRMYTCKIFLITHNLTSLESVTASFKLISSLKILAKKLK